MCHTVFPCVTRCFLVSHFLLASSGLTKSSSSPFLLLLLLLLLLLYAPTTPPPPLQTLCSRLSEGGGATGGQGQFPGKNSQKSSIM